MNIMTKYYRMACYLLKDFLPCVPELKLTNAKSYMGQCDKRGAYPVIRISRWNHVDSEWLADKEDLVEIIDTICHELAHLISMRHDELHKRATKAFKTIVLTKLEIMELEQRFDGGVAV